MGRLTKRINGVVVYTQGQYTDTTSGEMTGDDVRKVLAKLCEYEDKEHMTHADAIRNMTDEELAIIIMCPYDGTKEGDCFMEGRNCIQCCKEWLQAEVGDVNE